MSSVLLCYPHGLGDQILVTPFLKALKQAGYYIGFATLERFRSAKLFDNNSNVDKLYYTKDAWNEFPSFEIGVRSIMDGLYNVAVTEKYDKVMYIGHERGKHKQISMAGQIKNEFGIEVTDFKTEMYITGEDDEIARKILVTKFGIKYLDFGFIHTNTGLPIKDLPVGYGKKYCEGFVCDKSIEIGVDFKYDDYSINIQVALMAMASVRVIPDSVFYHAYHAQGLMDDEGRDLCYFGRGKEAYAAVGVLHRPEQFNIVYKLPEIN